MRVTGQLLSITRVWAEEKVHFADSPVAMVTGEEGTQTLPPLVVKVAAGVGVGVLVIVGVRVGVRVRVIVGVFVGVRVSVRVRVSVGVLVSVGEPGVGVGAAGPEGPEPLSQDWKRIPAVRRKSTDKN